MEQKVYTSLESAYQELPLWIRKHSERVSEYCGVLFDILVEDGTFTTVQDYSKILKKDKRELIKNVVKYHDIGKVFLPAKYQSEKDLTEEGLAIYHTHIIKGYDFVDSLELADSQLYLSVVEEHHEFYNGDGIFENKYESEIGLISRMVKLMNDFDNLVMSIVSDSVFDDALVELEPKKGLEYDPDLLDVLMVHKPVFRSVFKRYQKDSKQVPKVNCVIPRKKNRPIFMQYKPCVKDTKTLFYEGKMFSYADVEGEPSIPFESFENSVKEVDGYVDFSTYSILEAMDTMNKFIAGNTSVKFIAVPLLKTPLSKRTFISDLKKVLYATRLSSENIGFILDISVFEKMTKTMITNCQMLKDMGCNLVLNGVSNVDMERVYDTGFRYCYVVDKDLESRKDILDSEFVKSDNGITLVYVKALEGEGSSKGVKNSISCVIEADTYEEENVVVKKEYKNL